MGYEIHFYAPSHNSGKIAFIHPLVGTKSAMKLKIRSVLIRTVASSFTIPHHVWQALFTVRIRIS